MNSCTSGSCQSLQMVDRKTEYVIEASIPCGTCQSMRVEMADGRITLSVLPAGASNWLPLHSWGIEPGVSAEQMTTEYKNGTLFIRLPKTDAAHTRPLQYTESIEIVPNCG